MLQSFTGSAAPAYVFLNSSLVLSNFFTFSFLECQYAHGPQDLRPMVGGGSFGPSHPGMMGISANIKTITLHIEFVIEFSLFYRT